MLFLRSLSPAILLDATTDEVTSRVDQGHSVAASSIVSEIAFLVGFSEPSNFHRAFRRWTGTTPTAFRLARKA